VGIIILMTQPTKIKIQLDREVANRLLKKKQVGDTYNDIIKRELDHGEKKS